MHYTVLKYIVKIALRLFHRRHQVVGKANIPKEGSVIFAGNHQNALMDAINIICNTNKQPYFATRADLFRSPFLTKLLKAFKMQPVFRPRDGRRSMASNTETFDFFAEKLHGGGSVGIFPEGAASYKFQLLPLKKGLARLALRTVDKHPNLYLYIVPTGLQYSLLDRFQSDLLLQFGQPILVNDYLESYRKSHGRALRELTLEVGGSISKLMIDIQDEEDYVFLDFERRALRERTCMARPNIDQLHLFKAEKDRIAELLRLKKQDLAAYNEKKKAFLLHKEELKKKGLPLSAVFKDDSPAKKIGYWAVGLLLSPVLVLGWLTHYPLAKFIHSRTWERVKDPQFISTSLFAHGLVLFPCYYFILSLLLAWFFASWWCLALLFLLPIVGLFTFRYIRK